MSIQGVILIDLMALGFIVVILNLVRKHLLVIGYAIIWLFAVTALMVMVTLTPFRDLITRAVGAVYPASALSLLAFIFVFVVLIYFSVQLSVLSARQAELIQAIAVMELSMQEKEIPQRETPKTSELLLN